MGFGLLSVLQATVLPGFIVLCLLRINLRSLLQKALLSLGLSQLTNYLLVLLLVKAKIFSPFVMRTIVVVEVVAALWFVFRPRSNKQLPADAFMNEHGRESSSYAALQTLAIASLVVPLYYFWDGLGTGFYLGDAYGSWHRWALDWFEGRFPIETWRYPQLMPTNWAAMYAVAGTPEVQFFAKSYMAIFPFAIQLMFIATAQATRDRAYFCGAILYGLVLIFLTNKYLINDGYADIGLSFFCLLSYMCLVAGRMKSDLRILALGCTFACAAAVTKQTGLYWLAAVGVYLVIQSWRERRAGIATHLHALIGYCALIAIVVLPWWIYKEIQIRNGIEVSEVQTIFSGAWSGLAKLNYLDRAVDTVAGNFLKTLPQKIVSIALASLIAISVFKRSTQWITFGVVLPFIVLWAAAFGYSTDMRNVSLAVPFAVLSAAQGASLALSGYKHLIQPLGSKTHYALLLLCVAATLPLLESVKPIDTLEAVENGQAENLLPPLTHALYELKRKGQLAHGKIYTTDFTLLSVLPTLRQHSVHLVGLFDSAMITRILGDEAIGYIFMREDGVVTHPLGRYEIDQETKMRLVHEIEIGRFVKVDMGVTMNPAIVPPYQLLRIVREVAN
jgi:hypothetical protein